MNNLSVIVAIEWSIRPNELEAFTHLFPRGY